MYGGRWRVAIDHLNFIITPKYRHGGNIKGERVGKKSRTILLWPLYLYELFLKYGVGDGSGGLGKFKWSTKNIIDI